MKEENTALLKKKKNLLEYVSRFSQILQTDGFAAALRITLQYLTDPAVNPITRRHLYSRWIKNHEPSARQLQEQRLGSQLLPQQPVISIVIPVYNPPEEVLSATLDSVAAQTYPFWECCIANGDASNLKVKTLLNQRTAEDQRYKVIHLDKNLGIAGNTNTAISLATGSYVAFLDHDDLLSPFALYEVANKLWTDPKIGRAHV